jgi:hypothetical protein
MLKIVGSLDALKIAAAFDILASTTCYSNAELASALDYKNVSLTDAYLLINNNKLRSMLFSLMH